MSYMYIWQKVMLGHAMILHMNKAYLIWLAGKNDTGFLMYSLRKWVCHGTLWCDRVFLPDPLDGALHPIDADAKDTTAVVVITSAILHFLITMVVMTVVIRLPLSMSICPQCAISSLLSSYSNIHGAALKKNFGVVSSLSCGVVASDDRL